MIWLTACDEPFATPEPVEPGFAVVADQIPGGTLLGAWSSGDELLFVGGDLSLDGGTLGSLTRWDGAELCVEEGIADATLWWIHGPRAGEWYAVGGRGTILHEVDGVRTDESVPTDSTLYGVWAADDGRVWAVGGDPRLSLLGEVWLREDGAWSPFAVDLPGVVFKVWDRWFVGDGYAWHLEGDALVEVPLPDGAKVLTARGRADDELWAVGGDTGPVVLVGSADGFEPVDVDLSCTSQPLNGVWTAAGEDLWLAGATGAMIRVTAAGWDCPRPPTTFEHFHAVWPHADEIWFAGGNLFASSGHYGTLARWSTNAGPLRMASSCF